jgi:hypothetical protein
MRGPPQSGFSTLIRRINPRSSISIVGEGWISRLRRIAPEAWHGRKQSPPALPDRTQEACGSPQLIQRICLDVCFALNVRKEFERPTAIDFTPQQLQEILQQSTHSDFGTMVANMHQGPKKRFGAANS